jgi:DNA polymerase III subunit alpha
VELGKFTEKAVAKGHDRRIIEDIAAQIETFGRYGFNKSHSVAYSVISYHTAWLKAHFPAEFMAALLSSSIGDTDSVVKFINEARELGITVLPPDVNESGYKFTVVGEKRIRFGLGAIRNVGRGAIDSILSGRQDAPYTTLFDLAERVDLRLCNKRVFEALVHSGAIDTLNGHRSQYIAALDAALQEASLKQDERVTGQGSLFGEVAASGAPAHAPTLPNIAPLSESERLTREKEILGFYISGHPLEPYRAECELFASHLVSALGTWQEGSMTLGCVVSAIKRQVSKKSGNEFARLTVEDFSGTAELLVFPEAWAALQDKIRPDVPLLIKGAYGRRDQGADNPTFIVDSVQRFEELRLAGQVAVELILLGAGQAAAPGASTAVAAGASPVADLTPGVFADIRTVLEGHPGTAPVEVRWSDDNGGAVRLRSRTMKVAASGAALGELRSLLGQDRVRLIRVGG